MAIAAGLIIAAGLAIKLTFVGKITTVTGAVIMDSPEPHLQRPVANATVIVASGTSQRKSVSEPSGLFRITLDPPVFVGEMLNIRIEHPEYHPYTASRPARAQIDIVRLSPVHPAPPQDNVRATRISNLRVRYATRIVSTDTIGSAVRTFDIINQVNVPCASQPPCSPDGKWKARITTFPLDAGEHKQFRNVRVSCIAGPCPFTSIESDHFSRGGRNISVSVRNWADRVTYLVEAEVIETRENERVRHTYPVIFGRSMNFTLPLTANGLTIEADVAGAPILFPLGPQLRLSWAVCRSETGPEGARQYRCELKQGYYFE